MQGDWMRLDVLFLVRLKNQTNLNSSKFHFVHFLGVYQKFSLLSDDKINMKKSFDFDIMNNRFFKHNCFTYRYEQTLKIWRILKLILCIQMVHEILLVEIAGLKLSYLWPTLFLYDLSTNNIFLLFLVKNNRRIFQLSFT